MQAKTCRDCETEITGSKHKRCPICLARHTQEKLRAARKRHQQVNAELRARARLP